MDPSLNRFLNSSNGVGLGNNGQSIPRFGIPYPDQKQANAHHGDHVPPLQEQRAIGGVHLPLSGLFSNGPVRSASFPEIEDDYQEDCDFSDAVLRYIDQMLMEEDMDEKAHMLQESLDLQAKEKSFYDVLGKKYPPSPQQDEYSFVNHNCYNSTTSSSDGSGYLIDVVDPSWLNNRCCNMNGLTNVMDGSSESPISPLQMQDILYNESQPVWNFQKGVEEANKFLKLAQEVGEFKADKDPSNSDQSRGRKNRDRENVVEERSTKMPAVAVVSDVPIEEFDDVLLHTGGEGGERFAAFREEIQKERKERLLKNGPQKGSVAPKVRGKKQSRAKKEVIDLRTLLINCAQAVAADDRRNADELLKQIRRHSTPHGDGNQRLAHYFANGLEARLAGTGSQMHKALVNKRTTAADFLKAYYTYLASSPFRKISNFASNKTINMKSGKETRLHVIDFGILYGFQWVTLLERISNREGGPPKVRITGIDFPQPGFRPAERIEETGRRLEHYAKKFKVPFEYNAIAQKWEMIKLEDLKLEKDEFVVVNCLYRTKNLLDETVMAESPRTMVLNLIRRINPDIFIHGIVNGAYSAPFFVTRFREVLFHFSSLFDMLERNIAREMPERMLIERDIFGKEALNVIACEGWERVERPETYKQWQVRTLRAGFMQIPFERDIMDRSMDKVRRFYDKDFLIDEDSKWLLMGWKGRIIYAISCWKPV